MYCCKCMENIEQKEKHTYVVINRANKLYKCTICYQSSRFKTLINKSGLNKKEKEELMGFKRIMDSQNKRILKLIENLYEKTGIKLF